MELPWDPISNTFFIVHTIPKLDLEQKSTTMERSDNSSITSSSGYYGSNSDFGDERSAIIVKDDDTTSYRQAILAWIPKHKAESMALVLLLLALIVVPSVIVNRMNDDDNRPLILEQSAVAPQTPTGAPSVENDVDAPVSAPTTTTTTSPPPTTPTISPTWLRLQILDAFGDDGESTVMNALNNDPTSPFTLAYQWMVEQDDLPQSHSSSVLQRFVLVSFYFATGGRLTTSTWNVCSAVPNNASTSKSSDTKRSYNTFSSIKCVTELNSSPQLEGICASSVEFEECPEYYERFQTTTKSSSSVPPTHPKKRWLSGTNECDWYGVVCDAEGYVTQLSLPKNGLQGDGLLEELSYLRRLTNLNLRDNALTGSLPDWKGWKYLQHLSLSDNENLKGPIPMAAWSQWTWLETLDLENNQMVGLFQLLPHQWMNLKTILLGGNDLYIDLSESIGSAYKLEILDLSGNIISSNLPDSLGDLQRLVEFNIAGCGVTGTIPLGFLKLPNLVELQLQDNGLYGSIPEELWAMTKLEVLRLEDNQFSGTLSSRIGHLINLEDLRLSKSGLDGRLPKELENLQQLERAHFEFNNFKGDISDKLCNAMALKELTADCHGRKKVKCKCCTQCCDNEDFTCHDPDEPPRKPKGKRRR